VRPRIGLTSTRAYAADGSPDAGVAAYVRSINKYGGEAIFFENDIDDVDRAVSRVDGVVLTGGVDVDPVRYCGNPEHSRSEGHEYNCARDEFEIALVRRVRERGVPTLGICRGLQIANVAFGGTLIEDLVDELGEASAIDHRQTDSVGIERTDYAAGHEVEVAPRSALARLLRAERFATNSLHHQAIRDVGDGLVVVGRTRDGVIEAIDATFPHPFFYAVQWHPEELDDDVSAALFGGLIAAASAALRG
jgi:putative glutamine amidotransferase